MRLASVHRLKMLSLPLWAVLLVVPALMAGDIKTWDAIDWLDVVGEGGAAIMALLWLWLVLASRPRGLVTTLLYTGGLAYFASTWLDVLDEFIAYGSDGVWMGWVESLPAPVGMILLTYGLFEWHREQATVNAQLKRRERFYREHRLVDYLTKLYSADYLLLVLRRELRMHAARGLPLALVAFDIDDFAAFNRRFGDGRGDAQLRQVSEVLLAGLRADDLLCRFAGDRFIALLPATSEAQAAEMALLLQQQVHDLVGTVPFVAREGRCNMTCGWIAIEPDEAVSAEALVQRCQRDLEERKRRRLCRLQQVV